MTKFASQRYCAWRMAFLGWNAHKLDYVSGLTPEHPKRLTPGDALG